MDRLLVDMAGVLRGQALALRNIGDVLDAHGHGAAAEKAIAAYQLVLDAARCLEDEAMDNGAQNASVSTVQTGADHGYESRR